MLATFLKAHQAMCLGNDSLAILNFFKTAYLGERLGDPNYPGISFHAIGRILWENGYESESCRLFHDALDFIESHNGLIRYRIGIMLSLAKNYNAGDSTDKSREMVMKAMELSEESGDMTFRSKLLEEFAVSDFYEGKFQDACRKFKSVNDMGGNLSYRDFTFWAIAACKTCEDYADSLMKSVLAMPVTKEIERMERLSMERECSELSLERRMEISDSLLVLQNSIVSSDRSGSHRKLPTVSPFKEEKDMDLFIWIAISLAVTVFAILIFLYKVRKSRHINSDESDLPHSDETLENHSLIQDVDEILSADTPADSESLYAKYSYLNDLFGSGPGWREELQEDRLPDVERIFRESLSEEFLDEMVRDIDRSREGIAEKVMSEFKLRGKNRVIVLMYLSGVNYHAIAALTETGESSLSSQLSRLRRRIRESEGECRSLYERYF